MFRRSSKREEELLPWYVNGTLTTAERGAVERWLHRSPRSPAELADWRRLQALVAGQAQRAPSQAVRQRLMARVRSHAVPRRWAWMPLWLAWGGALALATVILLWNIIQPGIVLQWSVNDGPLTAFRVYRAPAGSADFDLLHEVPAQPAQRRYTYVDVRPWPGQTYVYLVEGVQQEGRSALSPPITASGLEVLPAQLAILLTGLVIGYGTMVLAQRWSLKDRGHSHRLAA